MRNMLDQYPTGIGGCLSHMRPPEYGALHQRPRRLRERLLRRIQSLQAATSQLQICSSQHSGVTRTPSTVAWNRSPAREYWGGELKEKIKGRISAALSADSAR